MCAVMCTPEGGQGDATLPDEEGRREDIGERKSCRVTDAESRGNDYFFIF